MMAFFPFFLIFIFDNLFLKEREYLKLEFLNHQIIFAKKKKQYPSWTLQIGFSSPKQI
jgi:hypothetical protein